MGMCHSLRSRLIGPQSAVTYNGRAGDADAVAAADQSSEAQVRERRRRLEERARTKAENKRSRNIDKSLKAEKREYKQTHRLLLLGESHVEPLSERNSEGVSVGVHVGVHRCPLASRLHVHEREEEEEEEVGEVGV
ncbi:guanine nucleotide-binding protein G(s) subunit alpha isoform X1 [Arapaima gigas]